MDMVPDLVQIRALAEEKEDENWRFRQFLKGASSRDLPDLDRQVTETTKRVWAGIDCTTCANYCREVSPTLNEEEVGRLARRLGMEQKQFIDAYLKGTDPLEENPWEIRTKPCPFLKENRCTIYEDRPGDCSGYPYLYKPKFVSRTMGMIERSFTCPIVFAVIEDLKRSTGFLCDRQR
jgi:Fe-S-cluster containining protein